MDRREEGDVTYGFCVESELITLDLIHTLKRVDLST